MNQQHIQDIFQEFAHSWPKNGTYYVWGTSNSAKKLCTLFPEKFKIAGFVDSNPRKWDTQFRGRPVLSPQQFYVQRGHIQCIVASMAYAEIACALEGQGLSEQTDFCSSWFFSGLHRFLDLRQVFLCRVDISITSHCTLRCRHCNMLIPYYRRHWHCPKEEVLSNVDQYFHWVDYVDQFNILGGEPFLHPEVNTIAEEIAKKYRSRIGNLAFFSNGTILPDEKLLNLMTQYQIQVDLGDYRQGIPSIQPKVDVFVRELERRGIRYSLPVSDMWLDFNHTPEDRTGWGAEELTAVRQQCREPFRGLCGQKLYFCHLNASADLAGLYPEEPGDFFDLRQTADEAGKAALLAFDCLCFPKGYVSYCRHCGGCGPANRQAIPVAEQLPGGWRECVKCATGIPSSV